MKIIREDKTTVNIISILMTCLAFLIDIIFLMILVFVITWILKIDKNVSNADTEFFGALYFTVYFTLHTIFEKKGRTLGMQICSIRILDIEGKPSDFRSRFVRLIWFFIFIFVVGFIFNIIEQITIIPWDSLVFFEKELLFMSLYFTAVFSVPITRLFSTHGVGILDYLSNTFLVFGKFGGSLQISGVKEKIKDPQRIRFFLIRTILLFWCFLLFCGLIIKEKYIPKQFYKQSAASSLLLSYFARDPILQYYLNISETPVFINITNEICICHDPVIYIRGAEMLELKMKIPYKYCDSIELRRELARKIMENVSAWQNLIQINFYLIDLEFSARRSYSFFEFGKSVHYYYDTYKKQLIFGIADSTKKTLRDEFPNSNFRYDIVQHSIPYNTNDDSKLPGTWAFGFTTPKISF